MWARRILITLIAMGLLAHPVMADIVMLRDGVKFVGTVVNRDNVRTSPTSYEWIGFVPDGCEEEMRFPASEVEYILFQDGAEGQLVEFTKKPVPYESEPAAMVTGGVDSDGSVAWIIAAGLVVAGISVLVKFSGEAQMSRSGPAETSDERLNALNYTLLGIGSAVVAGGVAKGLARSRAGRVSPDGLVIGCRGDQGHRSVAVAYRVKF